MRILQKTPYSDSKGIRINFGDIVYRRRGKEAISSYFYSPDELYCTIIKLRGDKIILGGLEPFMQDREELRRFCYLLKNGLPLLEHPPYIVECYSNKPFEKVVNMQDPEGRLIWLSTLKNIDIFHNNNVSIDVQEYLNKNNLL